MSEPTCCGEPMDVAEYDDDSDSYMFVCQMEPDHTRWIVDDEETWK